jgi:hypothetical protein
MARIAFYSFHYVPDNWRASQVRNMGVIEGNRPASDNDWESIKRGGDTAIRRWIDDQIYGKSVSIVLIGSNTAGRKWINYEIKKSWDEKKGVLGVCVHNLKDKDGNQSTKGRNPFEDLMVAGTKMSNIIKSYDPPYFISTQVYDYIKQNLSSWIEEAIRIRGRYD